MTTRAWRIPLVGSSRSAWSSIPRMRPMPAHAVDAAVTIVVLPIDDSWLRDSGPTFVVDASRCRRAAACFTFNAWGGKYHPYDQDALVAARIAERTGDAAYMSGLVVEGGGFCSDGEGTLITAETCVLNANRNPEVSKAEAEAELRAMLGVRKVIWVPGDATETETDGHVDGYLAYIKPGALLFEEVLDPADPRFAIMAENRRVLELETDAKGRRFELVPIAEVPPEMAPADARCFCRSYVNFYLANGAVIAPGVRDCAGPRGVRDAEARLSGSASGAGALERAVSRRRWNSLHHAAAARRDSLALAGRWFNR